MGTTACARLPTGFRAATVKLFGTKKKSSTHQCGRLISFYISLSSLSPQSFHPKVSKRALHEVRSDQLLRAVNPSRLIIYHDNVWDIDLWSLLTHKLSPSRLRTTCLMHRGGSELINGYRRALWYRAKW